VTLDFLYLRIRSSELNNFSPPWLTGTPTGEPLCNGGHPVVTNRARRKTTAAQQRFREQPQADEEIKPSVPMESRRVVPEPEIARRNNDEDRNYHVRRDLTSSHTTSVYRRITTQHLYNPSFSNARYHTLLHGSCGRSSNQDDEHVLGHCITSKGEHRMQLTKGGGFRTIAPPSRPKKENEKTTSIAARVC
jgi:hypothetical protein